MEDELSGVIKLIELESPLNLPASERHIACQAESVEGALEKMSEQYAVNRLDLCSVYLTKNDGQYWFILIGRRGKSER